MADDGQDLFPDPMAQGKKGVRIYKFYVYLISDNIIFVLFGVFLNMCYGTG